MMRKKVEVRLSLPQSGLLLIPNAAEDKKKKKKKKKKPKKKTTAEEGAEIKAMGITLE